MADKAKKFENETRLKNLQFLSLMIPLVLSLWIVMALFGFALNPHDFTLLPENIRIAHITNLFFQNNKTWLFPLTLTNNIGSGIPLSLTDNVPLMSVLYKLMGSSMHYFGMWLLLSSLLTAFFSYRIGKNISENKVIACLGAILMLTLPFLWYHTMYNYVMAGQWVILWAYSLFFRKKRYLSPEWFSMLIIACFIHPFFAFVCFCITVSNIIHLYVYNNSISAVKAASYFGHTIAISLSCLMITGTLYVPNLYTPSPFSFQLSSDTHNPSYSHLGVGVISGFLIVILTSSTFPKLQKYIRYFKPLLGTLILFSLLSILGGVYINNQLYLIPQFKWFEQYITPIFTSGAKFIIPILWLIPVILIHAATLFEKQKKHVGILFITALLIIQFSFHTQRFNKTIFPFVPIPKEVEAFLEDKNKLLWVYQENIPTYPPMYESIAYYAAQTKKQINSTYTVRFPTQYIKNIMEDSSNFFNQKPDSTAIYIIPKNEYSELFSSLGKSLLYKDVVLFKTDLYIK